MLATARLLKLGAAPWPRAVLRGLSRQTRAAAFASIHSARYASSGASARVRAVSAAAAIAVVAVTAVSVGSASAEIPNGTATQPALPLAGYPGTRMERTFLAIKPDGVQRGLIGDVIARFEKKGYKLVAMKMLTATESRAKEHYADLAGRLFFPSLIKYFMSGPVVCMVWEGPDVILTARKMLGATNPSAAAPGTLRGDTCVSSTRNIVHASDGPDSAKREIEMWFNPDEINQYARALDAWMIADQ